MSSLEFTVIGTPKPQQRPRAVNRGGFSKVYSPMTEWKERVIKAASELREQGNYFEQSIIVSIDYSFNRPKSHYGTGKNINKLKSSAPDYHIKRPDLDNLNKAVLDAIGDAGLWKDDSIVSVLNTRKFYTDNQQEPERATIWINDL